MKNKSEVQFAETGNRQGDTPASKRVDRHRFLKRVAGALAAGALAAGALAISFCAAESPPLRTMTLPVPTSCASSSAGRSVESGN